MLALNSTKKKMAIIIIMMILFLNILGIKSFALVEPTNDFYVNDYANLLSTDVEEYIISTNKTLNSQTGAQIVVVTVPNLEGQSIEEYATSLFRKFGIGDKTKNNGVLMLLALEERQMRIEVGYGLEGVLTDGKTGRIQDEYIIPYLKENNWNEGIRNGYSKILEEVANEYNVDVGNINTTYVGESNTEGIQLLVAFIAIAIIIFSAKIASARKRVKIIIVILDIISAILVFAFHNFINSNLLPEIFAFQVFILIFALIGNSGGGSSYFGGRRILKWWRLFRRIIRGWRIIWRRRIFKKFLGVILEI